MSLTNYASFRAFEGLDEPILPGVKTGDDFTETMEALMLVISRVTVMPFLWLSTWEAAT